MLAITYLSWRKITTNAYQDNNMPSESAGKVFNVMTWETKYKLFTTN